MAALLVSLVAGPQAAAAQGVSDLGRVPANQYVSAAAGGVLYLVPKVFDVNEGPPDCAPCDRGDVPFFDRWAIATERDAWDVASTVVTLTLAGATWWDEVRRPKGIHRLAASLEASSWAAGITGLAKVIIGRERPVLYTRDAVEAADVSGNQRSLPSGHTALAFALATSYWLSAEDRATPHYLALVAAATVGAMRVAAGRHFPSDVVAGAAVGVGTAVVVHEIRF